MRLAEAISEPAVMQNVGKSGEFHIRNSAKAFSILSDGLYSNKIRAIVRELATNAVDSHVEAGTPNVPIRVHLPTQLEPYFSVKDFGIGLDEEGVLNLYTTYFESTKTNSDDFVGALGLGSKSPFAYTDNFTVIAVKNGRRGVYTAYINDQGFPSIVQMEESDTDETNGVEVKFAVNSSDFHSFHQEARSVYGDFEEGTVQVNIKGFTFQRTPIIKKLTQSVSLIDSSYRLVMGHIGYPIDMDQVSNVLGLNEKDSEMLRLFRVQINAPIGSVDIQPSREGLSYTRRTAEYISNQIRDAVSVSMNEMKQSLDHHTNPWLLYSDAEEFFKTFDRGSRGFVKLLCRYVKQKASYLLDGSPLRKITGYRESHLNLIQEVYVSNVEEKYNINISGFTVRDGYTGKTTKHIKPSSWSGLKNHYQANYGINFSQKIYFVIQNSGAAVKRAKNHFRNDINQDVYILRPKDKNKPMLAEQFLREVLHEPPYVFYSNELDELPKQTSAPRKKKVTIEDCAPNIRSYKLKSGDHRWVELDHADKERIKNKNKNFYYVELNRSSIVEETLIGSAFVNEYSLRNIVRVLIEDNNANLFGVQKSAIKIVSSMDNWIPVDTLLKEKVPTLDLKRLGYANSTNLKTTQILSAIYNIVLKKDPNTDFVKEHAFLENVDYDDYALGESQINFLSKYYGLDADAIQNYTKQFDIMISRIYNRYGMLKYIDARSSTSKDIAQYIQLVDKATKEA